MHLVVSSDILQLRFIIVL